MITKLKKSVILTTGNGCSNLKQVETTISKWLNDMKTASIVTINKIVETNQSRPPVVIITTNRYLFQTK